MWRISPTTRVSKLTTGSWRKEKKIDMTQGGLPSRLSTVEGFLSTAPQEPILARVNARLTPALKMKPQCPSGFVIPDPKDGLRQERFVYEAVSGSTRNIDDDL